MTPIHPGELRKGLKNQIPNSMGPPLHSPIFCYARACYDSLASTTFLCEIVWSETFLKEIVKNLYSWSQ